MLMLGLHAHMLDIMPICLCLCFHMLVCLDLCCLHAFAIIHVLVHSMPCLDLGYVCHAICYCSPFVTLSFFLMFWPIGSDPI